MQIDTSTRRNSFLTALGIVIIALAVLSWGAQYKVSLYNAPGSHTTSVPKAKLLSPRERSASAQVPVVSRPATPRSSVPVLWALLTTVVFSLATGISARRVEASGDGLPHVDRDFGSNFFFFRPPPASIPAY